MRVPTEAVAKGSPRLEHLKETLSRLKQPENYEETVNLFHELAKELAHQEQIPPREELKFMTAKTLEVLNFKNPATFAPFQIKKSDILSTAKDDAQRAEWSEILVDAQDDDQGEEWPVWEKAQQMCLFLQVHGIFDSVEQPNIKRTNIKPIDISRYAVDFIYRCQRKSLDPETVFSEMPFIDNINDKRFVTHVHDLASEWKIEPLRKYAETKLLKINLQHIEQPDLSSSSWSHSEG